MKGKRLLAVLLAALMTASSAGMTAFAEDGAENTEQSVIENAQATEQAENVEENTENQVESEDAENTPVEMTAQTNNLRSVNLQNEEKAVVIGESGYDSLAEAIRNAEDGDIVTLNADVVLDECITIDKDITLDFNNKQVTTSKDMTTAFRIHADVIVKNGNMDTSAYENYCFIVGYYKKDENTITGNLTIKNGTYKGDCTVAQVSCGTLTIEGGEYSVKPYDGEYKYLLNCIDAMYKADEAKIYVKGGSFENYDPTNNAAEGTGTNFIAPGYAATANGNNYSVVKATSGVATATVDGETLYFATLQQAFDNADNDSTITLCEDIEIDIPQQYLGTGRYYYTVINNKKLVIDFNEKTIRFSDQAKKAPENTDVVIFALYNNSDVTFTGNGTVIGSLLENPDYDAWIAWLRSETGDLGYQPSKLTVENGTYISNGLFYTNQQTGGNLGGEITINDGYFASTTNNDGYNQYINVSGNTMIDGKRVIINGGTFDVDPRYYQDNWGSVVNAVKGSYMVDSNNYSVTMKTVNGKKEFSIVSNDDIVATVNTALTDAMKPYIGMDMWGTIQQTGGLTYSYTSLADAVANAVDGDVITLKTNASGDGIVIDKDKFNNNGLIIDLGGYIYTVDGKAVGSSNTKSQGFQFLKNNKITIKNGTLTTAEIIKCHNKDDGEYDDAAAMLIQNYADLTLEDVTLDGSKLRNTGYTLSNNNGNVTINSSSITANGGYAFDVCRFSPTSYPFVTVTVSEDSEIDGYVQISGNGETEDTSTATLKIGENSYTENGDYYKVGGEFVKTEKRSINISADEDAVEMGDVVTVTVTLKGTNITNAVYDLTYDTAKFKLVTASTGTTATDGKFSEEMFYKTEGECFTSGDVLATYTFKALGQTENVTADFVIENAAASTYIESIDATNIKTESNEKVSVAINLKEYVLLLKVNDETVSEKATVPYTNEGHTFTVTAIPDTTVTYTVNNGDTLNSVELTDRGTYEIAYTVRAIPGYAEYAGTFTLTIGDPEYVVEVNLTNDDNRDYVAGKKIVLVYTNTDGLAFNYGDALMIDVTSREYKYNGTEDYEHVYAFVTSEIDGATSVDDYKENISCIIPSPEALVELTYSTDLNFDEKLSVQDISTAYGIYNVNKDYFANVKYQKNILRADTNGDKVVNGEDTNAVVGAVKNK